MSAMTFFQELTPGMYITIIIGRGHGEQFQSINMRTGLNTPRFPRRIPCLGLSITEGAGQEIDNIQHEMALVVLTQIHGGGTIKLRSPAMSIVETDDHANTIDTQKIHTHQNGDQHRFSIKPRLKDFLRIGKHKN